MPFQQFFPEFCFPALLAQFSDFTYSLQRNSYVTFMESDLLANIMDFLVYCLHYDDETHQ